MNPITILFFLLFFCSSVFSYNSAITGIGFNSTHLKINNQYSTIVTLSTDSATPVQTTLHLYDNNNQFFSFLYEVDNQVDINAIIPYFPTTDGNHSIFATIDVNDDNPTDNNFLTLIYVFKGPDLAITNIFLSPFLEPNTIRTAQVFLANSGDEIVGFFDFSSFLDENSVYLHIENPLEPGESRKIDVNFMVPSTGNHSFKVSLDANNLIQEFSESNNVLTVSFQALVGGESSNLTKEEIEEIIKQFFEQRIEDTLGELTLCKTTLKLVDENLNILRANFNSCTSENNSCQESIAVVRNEHSSCSTNLSLAATNCQTQLQNLTSADLNVMQIRLAAKDIEIQKTEEILRQKETLSLILAAFFFLSCTVIGVGVYKSKKMPWD